MRIRAGWERMRTQRGSESVDGRMSRRKSSELMCTFYRVELSRGGSRRLFRVALASDLHDRAPDEALEAIRGQAPDCIAAVGDFLECRGSDADGLLEDEFFTSASPLQRAVHRSLVRADACIGRVLGDRNATNGNENGFAFLEQAVRIAPVLYSLGNHERRISPAHRERARRLGAILLDDSDAYLDIGGVGVLFGGLTSRRGAAWLSRFERSERGQIARVLLCHHPEVYEELLKGRDLDLILSGHAHGGQWRVFGKPLFAPGQGFFPRYAGGLYDGRLVVSRGLANTVSVPRFGNPPEIAIVDVYG